jgi:DNA polymerase-3 subunit delta'
MTAGEMRAFLAERAVGEAHVRAGVSGGEDEILATARGAPGTLLAARERDASTAAARRLLEGVERGERGERGERYKLALVQGVSGARGGFSDALDALTVQLHSRTRAAAERGDGTAAARYARAVLRVEEAKALASGNVNPQLVTASLLRSLEETLR